MSDLSDEGSRKRRKITTESTNASDLPHTLTSSISPPPLRRKKDVAPRQSYELPATQRVESAAIESPFKLSWIRDLPASSNVNAVTLKDILGDPLIAECWEFNYLHNLDYLMEAFDPDVRGLVKVHVVHGFWKNEDPSRVKLKEQASRFPNVTLHTAYMPEMFGTHHSKMLILIRHDSTAQVVIHTANMIEFDWTNMTQALWRSPLLPLLPPGYLSPASPPIGSGAKFKIDLLNYLRGYDSKRTLCKSLISQLTNYDFSSINAALVASVPSRQDVDVSTETKWGWLGLKKVLEAIPCRNKAPEIVVQISSIATLGANDKWLDKTFFETLSTSKNLVLASKPKFRIIFPTPDEIRRSLNGYKSGSAIHTKLESAAQVKQLQYLKPFLCHWAGDGPQHPQASSSAPLAAPKAIQDAGRKRAAPHIKTYIRFSTQSQQSIDWMLVTSANLSKQAWGEATNAAGEVRVSSYEIGVIIWPELFGEDSTMVPTFQCDTPKIQEGEANGTVVGARMPYDLPLIPYAKDDEPWCATKTYRELDWMGMVYNVGE